MVERNPNFEQLKSSYLFPEINRKKKQFLTTHPGVQLHHLGIGDTTLPLASHIVKRMQEAVERMGRKESYCGYGPEQGLAELRDALARTWYSENVEADELFISDGAKCDVGRLQMLFGHDITIAVQDPTYPVYVDTSLLMGQKKIITLPCTPENNFFPNLDQVEEVDLIYFCSPNNPTGTVATTEQLTQLVTFAKAKGAIIIFDAAYAAFIQDPNLPKTIYAIPGANEVAIEIGSFSKMAGFTGVRLGWTVVPKALQWSCGRPLHTDWKRLIETCFNGASLIAQAGGFAALEPEGFSEIQHQITHYLDNTHRLRELLKPVTKNIYGGNHIPYLWTKIPGVSSWDLFETFLNNHHVITTPGSGFGPSGEGFLRFSAFGMTGERLDFRTQIRQMQPVHGQPGPDCPQAS